MPEQDAKIRTTTTFHVGLIGKTLNCQSAQASLSFPWRLGATNASLDRRQPPRSPSAEATVPRRLAVALRVKFRLPAAGDGHGLSAALPRIRAANAGKLLALWPGRPTGGQPAEDKAPLFLWENLAGSSTIHRAMKNCLFCPNPADSLEHVLPQWLFRCIAPGTDGKFPVRVARYVDGKGNLDERKHLSLGFKARIVCTACNNGWMSHLESKVARTLQPLVAAQFPVLGHSFLDALKADAGLIALWLSKTALTTSFALPGGKRLPQSFAGQVALQKPPRGVWVDLAKARVTGIGAALTTMFPTINGNVFVGHQTHSEGNCFQFCLQVNQLLLRVGMAAGAQVGYRTPGDLLPFRIFPEQHRQVPENFEFEDLNYFCHSVALRTWAGCPGEVPLTPPTTTSPTP